MEGGAFGVLCGRRWKSSSVRNGMKGLSSLRALSRHV